MRKADHTAQEARGPRAAVIVDAAAAAVVAVKARAWETAEDWRAARRQGAVERRRTLLLLLWRRPVRGTAEHDASCSRSRCCLRCWLLVGDAQQLHRWRAEEETPFLPALEDERTEERQYSILQLEVVVTVVVVTCALHAAVRW